MARSVLHLRLWGAAALLVPAASAAAAPPTSDLRVYKPTADTYVTVVRPRHNFGRSPVLRVDGAPESTAFVRFRMKKTKSEIESVTLLLHPQSEARGRYAVRRLAEDEWAERSLTYATAPELSMRYASSPPVKRGVWSAIDVTSFVDEAEVNLAITKRGTAALAFGSRESQNGPRLVVRHAEREDVEDHVLDALHRR
jgi:hypothetical protein